MRYTRLAASYEDNKTLIDYSRTIGMFFTLIALSGLIIAEIAKLSPQGPLSLAIYVAAGMFGVLIVNIAVICSQLTKQLLLDLMLPDGARGPLPVIVRPLVWAFAFILNIGAAGIVLFAIIRAIETQ